MRWTIAAVIFLEAAAFCSAASLVTLSYEYASGKVQKEVSSATTDLQVSYDVDLTGIGGLQKLAQLKSVSLIGLPSFTDVRMLLSIPHLESVVIDKLPKLRGIESLFSISTLRSIIIRSCPGLAGDCPIRIDLAHARSIEYLQIADSGLKIVPVFSSIPKSLRFLNLSGNDFATFEPFEKLPSGVTIFLFDNTIEGNSMVSNVVADIGSFFADVPIEFRATY
jgi:hypothetical protein